MVLAIAEKVRFLSAPESYPGPVDEVRVTETHMSWVFLAGERVYKLKKPVHYPFLDFRTLAARERNCREEVRLNRRLAPDVYLGAVPLTQEADGALALRGAGAVVDWLVEMRRLPEARMLDRVLADGAVTESDVAAVAEVLIPFYRANPATDLRTDDYVAQFAREQAVTDSVLRDRAFTLDTGQVDRVLARIHRGIETHAPLLKARVHDGRIVEGHGDLRPEHVCLTDPPVIFDCLEFKRALRLIDPFDELAFLALECQQLGAGWIGHRLLETCAKGLDDRPPPPVLDFYWAYRPGLRARLALAHLNEEPVRHPDKWRPLAQRYLDLAETREISLDPPAVR